MLDKMEILYNQIAIALVIAFFWWLVSGVDPSGADEYVGTLVFAWIVTAIIGCFEKFE